MKGQWPILFVLLMIAVAAPAFAQTGRKPAADRPSSTQPPDAAPQASADETFDLDIPERRITRSHYAASTAVAIQSAAAQGLSLQVGVAVSAANIDVRMHNVSGHVRFKATLEPVLARIHSRPAPAVIR